MVGTPKPMMRLFKPILWTSKNTWRGYINPWFVLRGATFPQFSGDPRGLLLENSSLDMKTAL